jgi:hypothetical protein
LTVPLYALACVAGLALGWFAYDIAKAACTAVIERRRGGFSPASVKHGSRVYPYGIPTDGKKVPISGLVMDGRE